MNNLTAFPDPNTDEPPIDEFAFLDEILTAEEQSIVDARITSIRALNLSAESTTLDQAHGGEPMFLWSDGAKIARAVYEHFHGPGTFEPALRELTGGQAAAAATKPRPRSILDLPFGPVPPSLVAYYLHPEGPTVLYGPPGTAKGLVACTLASALAHGGARVLILDYENHEGEWGRRIRGMALIDQAAMHERIRYINPWSELWSGPKGTLVETAEALREVCDEWNIDYLIVDSYAMATTGEGNLGGVSDATSYFVAIAKIGRPSLTIAHNVKSAKRFPIYPFGSVQIRGQARQMWAIEKIRTSEADEPDEDELVDTFGKPVRVELRNTKNSDRDEASPQFMTFTFAPDDRIWITLGRPAEAKTRFAMVVEILEREDGKDLKDRGLSVSRIVKVLKEDYGEEATDGGVRTIFARNNARFEAIEGSNPKRWIVLPDTAPRPKLAVVASGQEAHQMRPERPVFGEVMRPSAHHPQKKDAPR